MATSEDDIRKGVILLLSQYGELTTSQVKNKLESVMIFDEDDKEMSESRSEMKIIQRIGNIVSHQKDVKKTYYNSYVISKGKINSIWKSLVGLNSDDSLKEISDNDVKKRTEIREKFSPRQIDWSSLNDSRDQIGQSGEEFIMRYETNRVLKFADYDAERIIHLSMVQGDGAGFDILSLNEDGTPRFIEVKTTKSNLDTPFYMTENERRYFEIHANDNNLFIYRVYNFDMDNMSGKVEMISAKELLNDFNFDPTTYKVIRK